jgi:hypothetical protein
MWLDGKTERGRTVLIEDDPYVNRHAVVVVDGEVAEVQNVRRYRDGGTTLIGTDKGTIRVPKRIGGAAWPTLSGETLFPVDG